LKDSSGALAVAHWRIANCTAFSKIDLLLSLTGLNLLSGGPGKTIKWQAQKFNLVTKTFGTAINFIPNDVPFIVKDPVKGIVLLAPFQF
jgi:hypothetical protein